VVSSAAKRAVADLRGRGRLSNPAVEAWEGQLVGLGRPEAASRPLQLSL
jgi:hypothetical protein